MLNYKISVIMGVYNCSSYLQEALDSLFNQTFQNFELIICDDGSSDNTYDIASYNAKNHDNIILIKNDKNYGLNITLNNCLKYAHGEYIARMDGDDISLPTRLEKEVNFLDNNRTFDIVSSAMIFFDDKGDFKNSAPIIYPRPIDFIKGTPFSHPASMFRKSSVERVCGYSLSKNLIRVEDYHLWFKLYSIGCRGCNLQDSLYKFRDDRNSYKRRNFRARINETYVRHIGFRMLKLPLYTEIFVLRPLLVYFLPNKIYNYFHRL